jgi:hypothetical protein
MFDVTLSTTSTINDADDKILVIEDVKFLTGIFGVIFEIFREFIE